LNEIITIPVENITPDESEIIKLQGIPAEAEISPMIYELISDAIGIFITEADPVALLKDISKDEFKSLFSGRRVSSSEISVINQIFPLAERLAIYVITLGHKISNKIKQLFSNSDFALGSMLDSTASAAADLGTLFGEKYFSDLYRDNLTTLLYSPGYCGWDISDQAALFKFIGPERIDVSLNESYLMTPIKSVSGVLVSGKKDIHRFERNFEYCSTCKTFSCRDRIEALK